MTWKLVCKSPGVDFKYIRYETFSFLFRKRVQVYEHRRLKRILEFTGWERQGPLFLIKESKRLAHLPDAVSNHS